MTVLAKKKRRECASMRKDGQPCTGHVLSDEGAAKLLDRGISLVADPTAYCSFHARTPEERFEMSAKGGSWSAKREKVNREADPERDPMPDEITRAAKTLIRELLAATLPNVVPAEPDIRKRALGVYLALAIFDPGDNGDFMLSLLPRSLHHRADDVEVIAQDELREAIGALQADEQSVAWETLARAS